VQVQDAPVALDDAVDLIELDLDVLSAQNLGVLDELEINVLELLLAVVIVEGAADAESAVNIELYMHRLQSYVYIYHKIHSYNQQGPSTREMGCLPEVVTILEFDEDMLVPVKVIVFGVGVGVGAV
jgi:hypothetical protein